MTGMICYEKWDFDTLEHIRSLSIQPLELKRSLDKIEIIRNEDDRVMVRYTTGKGDKQGRLYGKLVSHDEDYPTMYLPLGISIQGMAKWVRHFVTHKYYRDFDIVNAAPNLMQQILTHYSLCPVSLTHYNKNRSELFMRYSRQYGISRDEVKTVFIGILHTGKGDPRFRESMILRRDLDIALRGLSRRPEYSMLYKSLLKTDNPLGSFAFAVWSREEHKVLMQMREFFIQLGYHKDRFSLIYDGIMVEKDIVLDETPIDFETLSLHIEEKTGYILQIEEKSLIPSIEDLALLKSFTPT